jgi:hypothetical protein
MFYLSLKCFTRSGVSSSIESREHVVNNGHVRNKKSGQKFWDAAVKEDRLRSVDHDCTELCLREHI